MLSRFAVALVFSSLLVGHGLAEQPSVRFDLAEPHRFPSFVAIPFVFEDGNLDCPEARWTIKVSNGLLTIHHFNLPPFDQKLEFPTKYVFDPNDDATYRLQTVLRDCRVDIDVRQRVRVDGEWKSLLVTAERRPSLSEEARKEAVRKRLPGLQKLADPKKDTDTETHGDSDSNADKDKKQLTAKELNAKLQNIYGAKGPRRWGISTFGNGFPFDDAPKSCMDVFGEYQISKSRFAMAFFAPLPDELNKFVLEGSDLDPSHGRIALTKDDCRFEFTISQSVRRDSQWIALPLRPIPDDLAAKPADSAR
jgi:hypothetical protein